MSGEFDLRFEHSKMLRETTIHKRIELSSAGVLEPRTDTIPPAIDARIELGEKHKRSRA